MRITMQRVAQEAGVSTASVSIALGSKRPGNRRVSDETTRRIRNIAKSMGYRPNLLASNLRRNKTNTIGVLIAVLDGDFYGKILSGINDVFSGAYTPMLGVHDYSSEKERKQLDVFIGTHVDGIIAAYSGSPETIALYNEITSKYKIPVVLVDRGVPGMVLPLVRSDHFAQTHSAVKALQGLGHKRILYVTAAPLLQSTESRRMGYAAAMKESGDDNMIEIVANPAAKDLRQFACQILNQWQLSRTPASAMLIQNDLLAYQIFLESKTRKIRIPEDLSIMGLDDCYLSSLDEIRLSTVAQKTRMIGSEAAKLLDKLMKGQTWNGETVILPTEVVMRNTTGRCLRQ